MPVISGHLVRGRYHSKTVLGIALRVEYKLFQQKLLKGKRSFSFKVIHISEIKILVLLEHQKIVVVVQYARFVQINGLISS